MMAGQVAIILGSDRADRIKDCASDLPVVGQFAHGRHAQIARRVTLSQANGIAEDPKSAAHFPSSRLTKRGVSRSSRTLGAGCDGRGGVARRATTSRTAKPCGPDAPTLASSLRVVTRRRRWQESPVTGLIAIFLAVLGWYVAFAIGFAQAQVPGCPCTFKEAPWEAYGTKAACTTITRKSGTSCEIEFGGVSADPKIAAQVLGLDPSAYTRE